MSKTLPLTSLSPSERTTSPPCAPHLTPRYTPHPPQVRHERHPVLGLAQQISQVAGARSVTSQLLREVRCIERIKDVFLVHGGEHIPAEHLVLVWEGATKERRGGMRGSRWAAGMTPDCPAGNRLLHGQPHTPHVPHTPLLTETPLLAPACRTTAGCSSAKADSTSLCSLYLPAPPCLLPPSFPLSLVAPAYTAAQTAPS